MFDELKDYIENGNIKVLEYQLKNRVLPIFIASVLAVCMAVGMFFLVERFVYRPVMADMLYKEGYELLESNLFPQSEATFNRAVTFKPKKKWFFKYARGYCEKKQYDRSRRMYENSLLRDLSNNFEIISLIFFP